MASSVSPQGVRIVPPDNSVPVEEVLLAVGEQVGHDELSFASMMNKAVMVFLKQEPLVHQLIESGVFIRDVFVQLSPLSAPSTRITVSGEPTEDGPVVGPMAGGPGAGPAVADCGTAGAVAGGKDKDEKEQSQAEEQQADVAENSSSQTGQPQPADSVEEAAPPVNPVSPTVSWRGHGAGL
ncbi:hypothetical protein VZT92_023847 [Zoarces viviparus]|uniref:Uncharacterized protein n=1 Tax=Zoarces viviparus TaxID=48416 RepID=A0AAW1E7K4_ZOAVI